MQIQRSYVAFQVFIDILLFNTILQCFMQRQTFVLLLNYRRVIPDRVVDRENCYHFIHWTSVGVMFTPLQPARASDGASSAPAAGSGQNP